MSHIRTTIKSLERREPSKLVHLIGAVRVITPLQTSVGLLDTVAHDVEVSWTGELWDLAKVSQIEVFWEYAPKVR